MRRLVVSFLAIPLLALVPAGAAQAVGTCQGLPATIESPGGGTVTGTDGADVILVTAPADVVALGGDDTVCVAGGSLDAGSGNDGGHPDHRGPGPASADPGLREP